MGTEYKALCHGCHQMKPAHTMVHAYGNRLYCSKGCVAKAAWIFDNVPLPRDEQ